MTPSARACRAHPSPSPPGGGRGSGRLVTAAWMLLAAASAARAQAPAVPGPAPAAPSASPAAAASRLEQLSRLLQEQQAELERLRRAVMAQQQALDEARRALDAAQAPAAAPSPPEPPATAPAPAVTSAPEPSGVLTPSGRWSLEPSVQFAYSSSNRIALVGYTVVPSVLVGSIDVREVKRSTYTLALTVRYGLTDRLEVEAKLPWVRRSDTSIGREFNEGTSTDSAVFGASGRGLGDVEFSGRYQLNAVAADQPIYVAGLRVKTRSGRDAFEVPTTYDVVGFRNDGVQRQLATGSGFVGVQPGLTVLIPSDPAVFLGGVNYLHNVRRQDVVRNSDEGPETLGTIEPGGVLGFNFGMGMALNERSSFSIGYDHAVIGRTRQNGQRVPESVRLHLGTLLLGYAHRLGDGRSVNLSLGAGLTRDTPDLTLTLRLPTSH